MTFGDMPKYTATVIRISGRIKKKLYNIRYGNPWYNVISDEIRLITARYIPPVHGSSNIPTINPRMNATGIEIFLLVFPNLSLKFFGIESERGEFFKIPSEIFMIPANIAIIPANIPK